MSTVTETTNTAPQQDTWEAHYRCPYCSCGQGRPVAVCGHRMLGLPAPPGAAICKRCKAIYVQHELGHESSGF